MKKPLPADVLGRAEEAAVAALASIGDDAAFSELVRRRQSWLRNLLRRLCHNPALADDLAQQTLVQAWRAIRGLKSPGAFGSWLRRLAINNWLAHVRLQRDTFSEADTTEASATPTPGEQVDLDRALWRLSPDERLCVVLAYNEGMSHSEITEATGLPLGTVKSHIKRGAEKLRNFLQAYRPIEATHHVR